MHTTMDNLHIHTKKAAVKLVNTTPRNPSDPYCHKKFIE